MSDGMKTHEETTLANVVMNAFWFPEEYRPTMEFPEEPAPGKLAREYVTFSWTLRRLILIVDFI